MIVVNLKGGLGNQMFQYAAGLSLSLYQNTPLFLDFSQLKNTVETDLYTKRNFELSVFKINVNEVSLNDRSTFKNQEAELFYRMKKRFAPALIRNKVFYEPDLQFHPGVFNLGKSVYLDGYFQSEKYFQHIKERILSEFTLRDSQGNQNKLLAVEMKSCNSVSLHIRCGDYLKDVNKALFGGVCTHDYYKEAIQYLENGITNPQFYLFSDDHTEALKVLGNKSNVRIVEGNIGDKSYLDMYLMSQCRHHIIANSSFSWWGAWLNPSPDKIVIAPSKWFADSSIPTDDIVPSTWIRI